MTIQQLAGSNNAKGSNGMAALLGADDGAASQSPNAGFSSALRNSMAEADAADQATGAGHPATEDGAAAEAPEPQAQHVSASAEAMANASSPPPELQPLPIVPEPQLSADRVAGEATLQADASVADSDRIRRDVDTALTDASMLAAGSNATPLLSRLFTTIELPSAANEPHGASAFTRGLPYLIGMLREATAVSGGAGAAKGSGDITAGALSGTAREGAGWPPQGAPQLPSHAAALAQGSAADEQVPGLRSSADQLFTGLPGMPPEDAGSELPRAKSAADGSAAPLPPTLTAVPGTAGPARDARPLAGEAASAATPQFHSTHMPGSAAWVQDIGARIEWLQDMKLSKAELYLHPEELGALEISITTDNDTTSVAFITQTAAAREIIESTLPRLKELLASQGLQLDQSHVSQQSAEGHKRGTGQGEARGPAGSASEAPAEAATVRRGSGALPSGQIDQYV